MSYKEGEEFTDEKNQRAEFLDISNEEEDTIQYSEEEVTLSNENTKLLQEDTNILENFISNPQIEQIQQITSIIDTTELNLNRLQLSCLYQFLFDCLISNYSNLGLAMDSFALLSAIFENYPDYYDEFVSEGFTNIFNLFWKDSLFIQKEILKLAYSLYEYSDKFI